MNSTNLRITLLSLTYELQQELLNIIHEQGTDDYVKSVIVRLKAAKTQLSERNKVQE